eukprot:scaffold107374_cov33-Phaeocystis_antarctica.AAC.2
MTGSFRPAASVIFAACSARACASTGAATAAAVSPAAAPAMRAPLTSADLHAARAYAPMSDAWSVRPASVSCFPFSMISPRTSLAVAMLASPAALTAARCGVLPGPAASASATDTMSLDLGWPAHAAMNGPSSPVV